MSSDKTKFLECSRCILDSNDDPYLVLDENGICNHCHSYDEVVRNEIKQGKEGEQELEETINRIKAAGKGSKYDCLIGLSGGVDSSYVAYIAKQKGLRALCVHFDNGWNSEIAVQNIHSIVQKLDYDLNTYVIDWEEFKDLQIAYLKASVIDIEVLTDHAIYGTLYKIAKENNIEYICGGLNWFTEGILPYHWTYSKKDYINIRAIHKEYGTKKLVSFPFLDKKMKNFIKKSGVKLVNYLNSLPFNTKDVKEVLTKELNWKDYGGKHHESVWTRFYQCYILPEKFNVDKRKAHLSTLVVSGQITREEALEEMKKPIYDPEVFKVDKVFVLKKLGLSEKEFDDIMKLPVRGHRDFETEGSFFSYYPILKPLQPLWQAIRGNKKQV